MGKKIRTKIAKLVNSMKCVWLALHVQETPHTTTEEAQTHTHKVGGNERITMLQKLWKSGKSTVEFEIETTPPVNISHRSSAAIATVHWSGIAWQTDWNNREDPPLPPSLLPPRGIHNLSILNVTITADKRRRGGGNVRQWRNLRNILEHPLEINIRLINPMERVKEQTKLDKVF